MEATDVRAQLDQFAEQDFNRHTANTQQTIEQLMEEVVEGGTFTPDVEVTAELNLTLGERVSGNREQDMSAMLMIGMMLGAALERDVPMDSEAEELWREGEFTLPEGDA